MHLRLRPKKPATAGSLDTPNAASCPHALLVRAGRIPPFVGRVAHGGDSLCELTLHPNRHLNPLRGRLPLKQQATVCLAADSFVFPGRIETVGLVMLDAMPCSAPTCALPRSGRFNWGARAPGRVCLPWTGARWTAGSSTPSHPAHDAALRHVAKVSQNIHRLTA